MRAPQGVMAFAVMVWICFGAQLASGTLNQIIAESVFAILAAGAVQVLAMKWPPAVGLAILLQGQASSETP